MWGRSDITRCLLRCGYVAPVEWGRPHAFMTGGGRCIFIALVAFRGPFRYLGRPLLGLLFLFRFPPIEHELCISICLFAAVSVSAANASDWSTNRRPLAHSQLDPPSAVGGPTDMTTRRSRHRMPYVEFHRSMSLEHPSELLDLLPPPPESEVVPTTLKDVLRERYDAWTRVHEVYLVWTGVGLK